MSNKICIHRPVFVAVISLWAPLAHALGGIVTDGTVGEVGWRGNPQTLSSAGSTADVTIVQDMGTTRGTNLFHSFSEFNINTGQTATFTENVPGALRNVISRVTGSDPSEIDGTLRSSGIPNADFYFINPNGVTFGPGAQVDVPGAFHVSTADKIDFPNNGGAFYANPNQNSTLSSEAPAAFGFLGTSAANNGLIKVDGAAVAVQDGKSLDVVAGNITVENGAVLYAPAGEIRMVAMQGEGSVGLERNADGNLPLPDQAPTVGNAGNVTIDGSWISSRGNGGGRTALWGGAVSLNDSQFGASNDGVSDTSAAKGVEVRADSLSANNSLIQSLALDSGSAGTVAVHARTLDIRNGSRISSDTWWSGNAGTVTVNADALNVFNGGEISSDTLLWSGNAGTVNVNAGAINIDGGFISSRSFDTFGFGVTTGHAGLVRVNATGDLNVLNGGQISSSTWTQGNAGSVEVMADALRIDGQGGAWTGVASNANSGSTGNAGAVTVNAGILDILNGGVISSDMHSGGIAGGVTVNTGTLNISQGRISNSTFGQGNAGTVDVNVTGMLNVVNGGIISSDTKLGSSGNAGEVTVTAGTLDILSGGAISSDTYASGHAGNVTVSADALTIDRQGSSFVTGIFSDANPDSSGNAGRVEVQAGTLDILNGGRISSNTSSNGNAGTVDVNVSGMLNVLNGGIVSSDTTNSDSSGNAGAVTVNAGTLNVLNGGAISSDTYSSGQGGNVTVIADEVTIDRQESNFVTGIFSDANSGSSGNAGRVEVDTGTLDILNRGRISSNTSASGQAGNVTVTADAANLDGGVISSVTSSSGNAGEVAVNAGILEILNGGAISSDTYSSGQGGNVTVIADEVTIDRQGSALITGIFSDANPGSSGNAGSVTVDAGTMDQSSQLKAING